MKTPRLKAPTGACDTHMHFYDASFPIAPTARGTQPDATPTEYRAMQARVGLQRVVVVQTSTYGTDNRCTMEGVAQLGANARAVVVVDQSASDAELRRLTDQGARGIRYHMLPGGALAWDTLEPMARRVAPCGWHVQLQLDGRALPDYEARLRALPCDLVIDHNGKFLEPVGEDHPGMKTLLRLLDSGRCWVKLSAPYETSKRGPPGYDDVGAIAKALVRANPERCVWASNWPHPNQNPKPDDADLLDLLLDWAPDDATRARILVENPARLYGFV